MTASIIGKGAVYMVSAVIAAGGKGKRMGADTNKVYLELGGTEILARTLGVFQSCPVIDEIVVVTGTEDIGRCRSIIARDGLTKVTAIAEGGIERQDSVYIGLSAAHGATAVIHDGARCLITDEEIRSVVADAKKYGAAALGVPVKDTLKTIGENGEITGTVDRDRTVLIQTPQVFDRLELMRLHERLRTEGAAVTDDCAVFERYGRVVHYTAGKYENIKMTTPSDMAVGEKILEMRDNG